MKFVIFWNFFIARLGGHRIDSRKCSCPPSMFIYRVKLWSIFSTMWHNIPIRVFFQIIRAMDSLQSPLHLRRFEFGIILYLGLWFQDVKSQILVGKNHHSSPRKSKLSQLSSIARRYALAESPLKRRIYRRISPYLEARVRIMGAL